MRFGGTISYHESGGKELSAWAKTGDADGAAAGLASRRKAFFSGRRSRFRASLFDFGLYLFPQCRGLAGKGHGPLFLSAEDGEPSRGAAVERCFQFCAGRTGHSAGSIRATVLIETILAAFEMDEILYELRDHSAGLNCGRWDYIFSFIKKFRKHPEFVLPDRVAGDDGSAFPESYVELLIQTCHRRGIHAMGGMAAQIPIQERSGGQRAGARKSAAATNCAKCAPAMTAPGSRIRDLFRWPRKFLTSTCRTESDFVSATTSQRRRPKTCSRFRRAILRKQDCAGISTSALQYLDSWLQGSGCVPIYNLMEDAATAEICRAQVWQWIRHGAHLKTDRPVTEAMVEGDHPSAGSRTGQRRRQG